MTHPGQEHVLARIAREEAVRPEDITGRKRYPRATAARHRYWAVLHGTLGLGWAELARIVGRDHTSVMHGVRMHERRLETE